MSLSPNEKYPGATEADPNYKDSKFKDNNPSTTNNGSPLKALDRNEQLALQEAMMNAAGFDYNGVVDTPQNSQMFNAYKAALSNGANLLSNHNFIIASPDDSQPAPSATPTSYPPGYEIFSGVFANETTGILNLTYIDGRVSFSGGDFYMAVPNTGALENITEFVASVADFDGKPRTRGVSYALVGNEYRVTVGVDALEDESANETLLGSVKFEHGSVATGHEVNELSVNNLPDHTGVQLVNDLGLVPGGTDNTEILDGSKLNGKSNIISSGSYHIDKAFALLVDNSKVSGAGNVELIKSIEGATGYITWKENTTYENITVRSTLPDVPQIRTMVRSGAILSKCNVFDNKHDDPNPDAWGFYFKDVDGASLYDCGASGSSQSDFTIVDNVRNVTIINGTDGGHGSGCKLNIEPNDFSLGGVEGVKIMGGSYDLITVIEPFTVGQAINGVCFDSCTIGEFSYGGGLVEVNNCTIGTLTGLDTSLGSFFNTGLPLLT